MAATAHTDNARSADALTVLVVEDDRDLREALSDTLELAGYRVLLATSAEEALRCLLAECDIRMIVSDVNMGGMSGHDLLEEVRQSYPQIPMMLITAYASISDSVEAMKRGAVDYLVKPFKPEALVQTVSRHVGVAQLAGDQPVAEAASSKQLLQLSQRVAQSESTVLILGESGTGKEVLSRYIHDHSPRRDQPFIAINCAAIPENMLEAMLFGHEKGAYTGAHSSAPGKFEQANGGTLLLDEISEMDIGLQAKLLRVLQEREVERLGGRKTIKLDVRVIATSNRDMREQVATGKFREDLYYRLSVLPLQWAPLRERVEDIVPLAQKLLHKHAQKQNRSGVRLAPCAIAQMQAYPWPGNVRELDNIMQRALILQMGQDIRAADLGLEGDGLYRQKPDPVSAAQHLSLVANTPAGGAPEPVDATALDNDLKQREYEIIVKTLREENGSKKNTAQRLGISPRTLRYKIARLRDEGFAIA
ncbi:sigma-54-dependent transcriptional regulator [Marinimicrobium alkaliphilum]|uniref:sigma-54-dependent transcriptional regulator n=1 Tax=Marinimicrobium alkaliphilum TaxID=2202654 RepID=UPI000DBACC38|nr:sigma-54 dependent transcriptional regulator [Marinimicrobium alkaliphilum]